jgi:serine/threonine protein kinase
VLQEDKRTKPRCTPLGPPYNRLSEPPQCRCLSARAGPYEILSLLGSGGMGEVYRARDTKLGRDVALKILPDLFAADPERIARFEREAKTLASLNHPNFA